MPNRVQKLDVLEDDAVHEIDEVQEDLRQDATNAGEGDSGESDERLIIVRQPKQSDVDLLTPEVSTVRPWAVTCTAIPHSTGSALLGTPNMSWRCLATSHP